MHVERALIRLHKGDVAGDQNAGISIVGAHTQGNVAAPAKTPAALTVKRSAYFHLGGDSSVADVAPPQKDKLERCLDPCGLVKLESESEMAITAEVEESAVPSPMLHSIARRRGGMSSSKKEKAPTLAFAYGLQPFKVVHDIVPHSSSIGDTHFCVFPSTSGRVVSHQRDDKVKLFKVLRENLEQIKAGTLDIGSMRTIRLRVDGD